MMDLTDILMHGADEICGGSYYPDYPVDLDGPVPFEYEPVDVTEWHYQQLFRGVTVNEATTCAIRTRSPLAWKIGGYVALQDGTFYAIQSIQKDYRSASKQAFRYFSSVPGTEYVMRLTSKSNPYEVQP